MKLPEGVDEQRLTSWLGQSTRGHRHLLGHGYQAAVYLYEQTDPSLVVKTSLGSGLSAGLRQMMLRREWEAYRRLEGVEGVPRCYGLLDGQHLVIEYVEGTPFREAHIADRKTFFEKLLALVDTLHERGVAHCDLKKKENVIVLEGERPCFIDFGAAIRHRAGFAPLNHYLYRMGCILDRNACIKLYYGKPLDQLSPEQLAAFERTRLEKFTRWVRALRGKYRELSGSPRRR
jgi:predicted Ser/Thr protein kinase